MKKNIAAAAFAALLCFGQSALAITSGPPSGSFALTGDLTPETVAVLTRDGEVGESFQFVFDSTVVASTSTRPEAPQVGDAITVTTDYFVNSVGQGNLMGLILVVVEGPSEGFGIFEDATYNNGSHQIAFTRDGATVFTFDAAECGLADGASLLDFADAANTGCATFSGGEFTVPAVTGAAAPITSASFTVTAVPIPAMGALYGLGLLGAVGMATRKRRSKLS